MFQQDPSSAIPRGTLIAIGITFVSYVMYPFLLSASVVRDASGKAHELWWTSTTANIIIKNTNIDAHLICFWLYNNDYQNLSILFRNNFLNSYIHV